MPAGYRSGSWRRTVSFAKPFACEFNEDVFEGGAAQADVIQFESLGIDPFDNLDESAGRAVRGDSEPPEIVRDPDLSRFRPLGYGVAVKRLRADDLNCRFAGAAFLQLARRTDRDNSAGIDDGNAIAEALGLFDVMRGEE